MRRARFADQRALAAAVTAALLRMEPASEVSPRGSLAAGTADAYCDVDLAWVVPDGAVAESVRRLPVALRAVSEVASMRSDPDFQGSAVRRLIFVRFAGVPLFWRLDLEVSAASHAACLGVDVAAAGPRATDVDWSLPESAAMNAAAAIKALHRGRPADADGLLTRGFARIDEPDPGGGPRHRVTALAAAAAGRDPRLRALAADITAHLTRTRT